MEHIYSDILKTEKEERSMFEWLQTLPLHSYQQIIDQEPKTNDSASHQTTTISVGPQPTSLNTPATLLPSKVGYSCANNTRPLEEKGNEPSMEVNTLPSGKADCVVGAMVL